MLLLNIRRWRRLTREEITGGEILKKPGPDAGCRAIEEEKEEEEEENEEEERITHKILIIAQERNIAIQNG